MTEQRWGMGEHYNIFLQAWKECWPRTRAVASWFLLAHPRTPDQVTWCQWTQQAEKTTQTTVSSWSCFEWVRVQMNVRSGISVSPTDLSTASISFNTIQQTNSKFLYLKGVSCSRKPTDQLWRLGLSQSLHVSRSNPITTRAILTH